MGNLPDGYGAGKPDIGFDLHNTGFVTGVDVVPSAEDSTIIFEKSMENGQWTVPTIASYGLFSTSSIYENRFYIDTNPTSPNAGSLYISALEIDPVALRSTISMTYSHDGGASWKTVAIFPEQPTTFQANEFSDITTAADGTVYVSWLRCTPSSQTQDCGGVTGQMLMSSSHDGGNTWGSPVVIANITLAPTTCRAFFGCLPNTPEPVSNIPVIAVSQSGQTIGHIYATFYTWTGSFMQVLVTTSTDQGVTWSIPQAIAPQSNTHDQFFPWLTVSNEGQIGVSWLDRRNDPGNVSYQPFAAISANDGKTFGTNVQLSSISSNPFNDGFGGSSMGDHIGNAWMYKDRFYVTWMDSRNGTNMQDEIGGMELP